jgi:hypothetical protein
MFAKSAAGKYSLDVLSLEAYYHDTDSVILLGGERKTVQDVACSMVGGAGYVIQRRLAPAPRARRRIRPTPLVRPAPGAGDARGAADPPGRREGRVGRDPVDNF